MRVMAALKSLAARRDICEVHGLIAASGAWELVAIAQPVTGSTAIEVADSIIAAFNVQRQQADLLDEARDALQAVLDEGLTYATEQGAEHVVNNIGSKGR